MLELKNVSKFYYQKGMITTGCSKVNLNFEIGEFVAITGESGSGKSTLLNVISGLDNYDEGEMYVNGEETSYYSEKDYEVYRKKYIGNIFQNFNLINSYTVYQNIELVYLLNGYKASEVKEKIINLIKKVDLLKYKNRKISKLSGGQKQRVAIARAIAEDTPIILADEPTGNLDKEAAKSVLKLLYEISNEKLVIIVTHNYEQVEEYATRKITMSDGRIVEDKKIKKYHRTILNRNIKHDKVKILSKLKLGFRSSFNILSKFLIILAVYLFVVFSLFTVYTAYVDTDELTSEGYNNFFNNEITNRIILKKDDKSYFTNEDYEKIKKFDNISKVQTNDMLLDTNIYFSNNDYYTGGEVESINAINKVDLGRLPKNNNEFVIEVSQLDSYFKKDNFNNLTKLSYHFTGTDNFDINMNENFYIVGIIYNDNYNDTKLYLTTDAIKKIEKEIIKVNTNINYILNNKKFNSIFHNVVEEIIPNKNVPQGTVYISESLSYICKKSSCKNEYLEVNAETIYSRLKSELKITKIYNKDTLKKLTGLSYNEFNGAIFINPEDYDNFFEQNYYQLSLFLINNDLAIETVNKLNEEGYNALYIRDTLSKIDNEIIGILKIIKLIINITLVVTLFFISYFVIKLVLKSRNIYFSTLRILGATFKDTKIILNIELFSLANLAYIIFVICIVLNIKGIANMPFISNTTSYFEIKHYIIIYIIITIMTLLITERYSRKLFKNSVMNTYREEV